MLAECIRSNQTSQAIITHYNHRLSAQYPFVSGNPRTNNQVGFFNQLPISLSRIYNPPDTLNIYLIEFYP